MVNGDLKKMTEDQYGLMVRWQLTQKKLELVRGDLKGKHVLAESLPEATKARKRCSARRKMEWENVSNSRQYEICVQECIISLHGWSTTGYRSLQSWRLLSCDLVCEA